MAGSTSWSCAAAGDLCWMACKERGWEDGDRTIMDAAVSTVTSTLPRDDRDGGRAGVRAALAAALLAAR